MSRLLRRWFMRIGVIVVVACTDSIAPPSPAVQLAFTVQPSSTTAGVAFDPVVAVAIEDAFGNLVPNATNVVTVTLGTISGGDTLKGVVSAAAVQGVATFSNLRLDRAAAGYTLKAAATGLTGATSMQFTIAAASPTRLAFAVQPSNTMGGAAITPPVQVAAQDSFGNLVTGFRDSVTVALGGIPATATLSGNTVVTAINGVATFSDLSIAQASAGYVLIASAGALTSGTSGPFSIAKPAVLHVSTTTTGLSFDPDGYRVCVDLHPDPDPWGYGGDVCTTDEAVGVNSGVSVSVVPGTHTVNLDDVADNCTVSGGNTRTVTANDSTDVPFAVTCAAPGSVKVTTATSGTDIDPDGYVVCVDRSGSDCRWNARAHANDQVTIAGVTAGLHTVRLIGSAGNCLVNGTAARLVTVAPDGAAHLTFDVRCVVTERIAYSSSGILIVGQLDGSVTQVIAHGFAPAWSPDGARLAYECGQDICAINADSTGFARLTMDAAGNQHPTWSPDGSKIAFAATQAGVADLYVMRASGSGAVRLTQDVGFVGSPAWSPDGTKIAFDCRVDAGNDDLCSVNADGSGFARLTNDPARDYGAVWKPDGSTLAFATTRYLGDQIAFLNLAGGGVMRAGLAGFGPTWSPDGTQLAFVQTLEDCDGGWDYTRLAANNCTTYDAVSVAYSNGSNVRVFTTGTQPAWRPHP